VANAVKSAPHGGTIGVRLGRGNGGAVLEVTDEGPGIPPDERSLVFEAFYQGRPPERDQYPGTGLGLAIARDYVQMNGGDIDILDAERGSRFRVQFPLADRESS